MGLFNILLNVVGADVLAEAVGALICGGVEVVDYGLDNLMADFDL